MRRLFIGIMSGTSMDGVDAALCEIGSSGEWGGVVGHTTLPFDRPFKSALMVLQAPSDNEIHRAALAGNALALFYAEAVEDLLQKTGVSASQIEAIGCHGQTIRHQPGLHGGIGYTLQIGNASLLAERCGIPVVADFRSRDVAAGGQGAPLVPPFHAAVFGRENMQRCVVNIGGISNITTLIPGENAKGWDCGPGNVFLDLWASRHIGCDYDHDGAWGADGHVIKPLLELLFADGYFREPPPKSTGRDLFNPSWLDQMLAKSAPAARQHNAQDVQATLCAFTAEAIARDVEIYAPGTEQILVCGGGALNGNLILRLRMRLPSVAIMSSATGGIPPCKSKPLPLRGWLPCTFKAAPQIFRLPQAQKGPGFWGRSIRVVKLK